MGTSDNDAIIIETIINASIEKVWKAWTDPALILTWFGSDPNGKGLKAEMDVRPGGYFEISFSNADQAEHVCSGVYTVVQEFSKLAFTWTWKSEPGVESFVTVILVPENKHTRMFFQHAHVGTASEHNYLNGWQTTFAKLDRVLTNK